jgi:AcrR family transcriptional regulator
MRGRYRSGHLFIVNYHHGDLRNALVSAGVELLAEQGVEALSLREVARRAGVSHAAPYRHFSDKQALLTAIAEQGFGMLNELVRSSAERNYPSESARLKAALAGYLEFGRSHPHHAELMFGALARIKPAHLEESALGAFDGLVELVRRAMRDADPADARNPRLVALALWGQTHGFLALSAHVDLARLVNGGGALDIVREAVSMTVDTLLVRR